VNEESTDVTYPKVGPEDFGAAEVPASPRFPKL
jgi:hypothetical protein